MRAIAPLLPTLAHQLHLSKLSAGVMTASYPLGTLLGSVPGGMLAARAGPKTTVCAGLALLAGSTLAFGFLHNAVAARRSRGSSRASAARARGPAGIAWIVGRDAARAPRRADRRALGAAIGGALFGPLIGTIATAAGRGRDVQRRRRSSPSR